MNTVKDYQRITGGPKWSLARLISGINKSNLAIIFFAVAIMAIGSVFLVNYPLETMIVTLFIGSVFVLDRK